MQREAFIHRPPSPGRGRALLAHKRGGRHLAARHPVNSVIHKETGNSLSAIGGMNNFRCADGGQVAVALIRNHHLVGACALQAGSRGRGASVRHLHVAYVKVVVGEHRAAHRTDKNGAILHSHILDRLGNQLVHNAVSAARTVVGLMLQLGFTVVEVVKRRRLGVDHLVFRLRACLDFRFHHLGIVRHGVFLFRPAKGCAPPVRPGFLLPMARCRPRARKIPRELCRSPRGARLRPSDRC